MVLNSVLADDLNYGLHIDIKQEQEEKRALREERRDLGPDFSTPINMNGTGPGVMARTL